MFVLRTGVFGYQSLFVCVCVGVQFLPLSSPSCVAFRSRPIGSHVLSHHQHLRGQKGMRGGQRSDGKMSLLCV